MVTTYVITCHDTDKGTNLWASLGPLAPHFLKFSKFDPDTGTGGMATVCRTVSR